MTGQGLPKRVVVSLCVGAALLGLGCLMSLAWGSMSIAPTEAWDALWGEGLTQHVAVIRQLRAPRLVASMLSGACLAAAGVALQAHFRNPLADPALLGVSTGGACGAATGLWLGGTAVATSAVTPVAAFIGALAMAAALWRMSLWRGRPEAARMLLAGLGLNALAGAGLGVFLHFADDNALRAFTGWMLGSFAGVFWSSALWAMALCAISVVGLLRQRDQLDAMLLGHAGARQLGFDPERALKTTTLWACLGVGASVSMAGVVGFVGLVVPHAARLWVGVPHRALMPTAVTWGATLAVWADLACRTLFAPIELPIGVVTSLLGAPVFLWLVTTERSSWSER